MIDPTKDNFTRPANIKEMLNELKFPRMIITEPF